MGRGCFSCNTISNFLKSIPESAVLELIWYKRYVITPLHRNGLIIFTCSRVFYFDPTEESLSWLGGLIELPAKAVGENWFEVGAVGPMGLDIGGLREVMFSGGLGTEFATFMAILLAGIDDGIGLDEEPGKPRRAAIICARSW